MAINCEVCGLPVAAGEVAFATMSAPDQPVEVVETAVYGHLACVDAPGGRQMLVRRHEEQQRAQVALRLLAAKADDMNLLRQQRYEG